MNEAGCHWLPELGAAEETMRRLKTDRRPPAERLAEIARLAHHDLDFLRTNRLDRYLQQALDALTDTPPGFQRLRLAWLASSTVDHLAGAVRIAALRRGLLVEIRIGAYGQYRQELFDRSSWLRDFAPEAILITLDPADALPRVPLGATGEEAGAVVEAGIGELRELWRAARETHRCAVIQQTVPNLAHPTFGSFDALLPSTPSHLIAAFNARLCRCAAEDGVSVLDLDGWSAKLGHEAWFDPVRWHHAKQLVTPAIAPLYGDLVARVLAALRGLSKKCLVLDLDNTLWGGVVGDDGIENIVLGQGSADGEAYAAFQTYAKMLHDRGIILAVCSKNELSTAEAVFRDHAEMVLRREHIAVFVANWTDKAQNLRDIAKTLQIGLDSLVFVDDNPAERRLVRAELPMVGVPELPPEPALYAHCLADAGYFEAIAFTADDLARARQYADNAKRHRLEASATDLESYLRGLQMELAAGPFLPADLPRVVQLINKTNQFNLRTRRYSEVEVRDLLRDSESIGFQFRLTDCLGDNGLISIVIARPHDADAYLLDTWLMSCRVLGRQVEEEVLNVIADAARRRGRSVLVGEYLPTPKNGMVSDLFSRLGFRPLTSDNGKGISRWMLDLTTFSGRPTHITTRQHHGPEADL